MNKLKKLINDENKTRLIGVFTILVVSWLILYFIPELFSSLFNTILGNLLLLTLSSLVLMYDVKYGIIVSIILIIIYRFSHLKEGFSWNPTSTQDFLQIQNTINRNKIFDVNMIQQSQASQKELDYFNRYGMWPWSKNTIKLYESALNSNPYVRTYSKDSIKYARTIYNEAAILRILSYQTKEGKFLLNGVLVKENSDSVEELPSGFGDFPYESGLTEDRTYDIIKCNMNKPNGATLERIKFTGKGGIYGEQTTTVTPVDYNNLEKVVPGFTFINGTCNPCGAVNEIPDYSCPFRLKVKNEPPFISNIWQTLWNINDNPLVSTPSFLNENINPKNFPLLNELQTELNKQN